MKNTSKRTQGRPKKIDPKSVLKVAMYAYWENNVLNISVNQLCKLANVSKPSLYREFKNEDYLMMKVLKFYEITILKPMHELIKQNLKVENLSSAILKLIKNDPTRPKGCLYVKYSEAKHVIGPQSQKQLKKCYNQTICDLKEWIQKLKKEGAFPCSIETAFAAKYINAQVNNAARMHAQGEDVFFIQKVLHISLMALV